MTPVYMALTKKRKDSLAINTTLGQLTEQLKASPYYQELLNKYQLNFK
jgi:Zn-dependent M16 (insulinase) family peptidase